MEDNLDPLTANNALDPLGLMNGLDLSISSLIAGILFGIIGLYLFRYGRKNQSFRMTITGLLLMIYPYFTRGAWMNWGIGLGLTGYAYYTWRHDS